MVKKKSLLYLGSLMAPNACCNLKPSDSGEVKEFLSSLWQINPLLWKQVAKQWPKFHNNKVGWELYRDQNYAIKKHAELQNAEILAFAHLFKTYSIDYVFLKSSAMRWMVYENPLHRCGRDVDVLVKRDQIDQSLKLIEAMGYHRAQWNNSLKRFTYADEKLRQSVEKDHFELGFYVKPCHIEGLSANQEKQIRNQLVFNPNNWHIDENDLLSYYYIVDVHHRLSIDAYDEDIMQSSISIEHEGFELKFLSLSWNLFFLIYKLYWEGVHNYLRGGYQFADLCRIVSNLNYDSIVELDKILARYRLKAAAYYVLRRLPSEFGIILPQKLQALVDDYRWPESGLSPIDQNDLGDMWEKTWGHR